MKPYNLTCAALMLIAGLVSCNGGGSGGTKLDNPTVEEMAKLEKQWGVEPREPRARQTTQTNEPVQQFIIAPQPAPQPRPTPAPEPAPLPPTTPTPVPPLFEPPPQPTVTPDQINKLKN